MKPEKWMKQVIERSESAEVYVLRLYITGASPNSIRAVDNIKSFCDKYLENRCQLEIIDVHQQPIIAQQQQIVALPMLIKLSPAPERRLIGDMSDLEKLLNCFNIKA